MELQINGKLLRVEADPAMPLLWLDELAAAGGKDPVEYRLALLADAPRFRALLNLATQKSGWGGKLPAGRARGVALHESFGSIVAQMAEVSLQGGVPRVRVQQANFPSYSLSRHGWCRACRRPPE